MTGNDNEAIKRKENEVFLHRPRWNGPVEEKKEEEEDAGDGIWGRLSEDYLRVVAVLGRNILNNTKIAAYHEINPLRLPSGLERSDGDAGSNWERGVNPSLHCQRDHIRATAPSYYTSLIHCAVVCIWLEVHRSVLPPTSPLPTLLNCTS